MQEKTMLKILKWEIALIALVIAVSLFLGRFWWIQ